MLGRSRKGQGRSDPSAPEKFGAPGFRGLKVDSDRNLMGATATRYLSLVRLRSCTCAPGWRFGSMRLPPCAPDPLSSLLKPYTQLCMRSLICPSHVDEMKKSSVAARRAIALQCLRKVRMWGWHCASFAGRCHVLKLIAALYLAERSCVSMFRRPS